MTVGRTDEIRYLREKANQFRELARTYRNDISAKLIEIATDLESRAQALENGRGRT
jgi:hypothetical protein